MELEDKLTRGIEKRYKNSRKMYPNKPIAYSMRVACQWAETYVMKMSHNIETQKNMKKLIKEKNRELRL